MAFIFVIRGTRNARTVVCEFSSCTSMKTVQSWLTEVKIESSAQEVTPQLLHERSDK
jgi:hypothetical protein